jgi:NitT/TauT family transport system substrate-binding protein
VTFLSRRSFTAAAASFGVAGYAGIGKAQTVDKITVGLGIPLTVTDGSVYALAEELGFFKEENLQVDTIVLSGAGTILPQLLQKQITLGHPLPEALLSAHKTSEPPLPLTFVYNSNPYNSLELAVLESSAIHEIEDLRGGKIGVGALTWGTIPQTRALLRKAGLEPGRDASIVAVGVLGSGFHALREGIVQALNFNSTWNDLLELEGTKVRRLTYPETFKRTIANGFLAHREVVAARPDLFARFGRAFAKATVATDANPRAAVEAFWRRNPQARPSQGDPAKALADNVEILKRRLELLVRDENGRTRVSGEFDLGIIRDYVRDMHTYGEFATADIPLDVYFTNALVNEYNRFDRQTIAAKAVGLG